MGDEDRDPRWSGTRGEDEASNERAREASNGTGEESTPAAEPSARSRGNDARATGSDVSPPRGITSVPRQVQRAVAKLADSGEDVFHVRVDLAESATERDREALVTGLSNSEMAIERLDADAVDGETATLEDDVVEFVTAPRFAVDAIVEAIEQCSFVDEVRERRLLAATPEVNDASPSTAEPQTARGFVGVRAGGERGADDPDGSDAGDDPSGSDDPDDSSRPNDSRGVPGDIDRLERRDELSHPDDEVSLREVLEGETDESEVEGTAGNPPRWTTRTDVRRGTRGSVADADGAGEGTTAIEVRVGYLESRFSAFEAYVDELERLLDDQARHERHVASFESALDDVRKSVTELEDESVERRRDVEALRDDVEVGERERSNLSDALDDVLQRQRRIDEEVDELENWRDRIVRAMGGGTE